MTRLNTRYVLFHGDQYYPRGGFEDEWQFGEDLKELIEAGRKALDKRDALCWAHIFDFETGAIVWEERRSDG